MTIRSKLILMLAIPLAALGLVSLFGFLAQNAQAEVNNAAQVVAESIVALDELAVQIADERLTVASGATRNEIDERIEATNTAAALLGEQSNELSGPAARQVLLTLGSERGAPTPDVLDRYERSLRIIDEAISAEPLSGFSADAVVAVNALQDVRRASNQQDLAWLSYFSIENSTTQDLARLTAQFETARVIRDLAAETVLTNGVVPFQLAMSSDSTRELAGFEAKALQALLDDTLSDVRASEVFPALISSRAAWEGSQAAQDTVSAGGEQLRDFVLSDAEQRGAEIDSLRSLFTLLAVLGGMLLFTLIVVIGRSILGPLNRLIAHADQMTQERLPLAVAELRTLGASDELPEIRPIPKESNDEIGTLVDAFNAVQETAVKVATDQARSRRNVAEMFVSLGRRNQQLNHRMINLISELERDMQDPEMLSGLYQLDHMATRMRRNAESLLVLAGNRSPRQWSRPVALEDVFRSSLAEVELFERVEIGELPDSLLYGNVVTDLTHLLAELLDNATQFSEPSKTVTISAQETLEGVEIEVFDEGFGVNADDLVELNERINNPPALDEAPSRLLGLFVVGRLAEQHNIVVHLESQPGVGTVATVSLPSSLFPDEIIDRDPPIEAPIDPLIHAPVIDPPTIDPPIEAPVDPLIHAPAIDPPTIDPPIEAPVIEIRDSGDLHADLAGLTALTSGEASGEVGDGIPAWNPAAIHDEVLADAAVPTIDEIMDALPTFPGVTIDEPTMAGTAATDGDSWPIATLEAMEADQEHDADEYLGSGQRLDDDGPRITFLDALPERHTPLEPTEMYAPAPSEIAIDEPEDLESEVALEPEVEIEPEVDFESEVEIEPDAELESEVELEPEAEREPEEPIEVVHEVLGPVEEFEPTDLFNPDEPITIAKFDEPVDVLPVAPPVPKMAPVKRTPLPAPPILVRRTPIEEAAEEIVPPAVPEKLMALSALPTRSPLAALRAVEDAPRFMPLASSEVDHDESGAPAPASAFAAFASGVNLGLDAISNESKPKFSSEGISE